MAELDQPPALKRLARKLKNPFNIGRGTRVKKGPHGGLRGGAQIKSLTSKKKRGKYFAA